MNQIKKLLLFGGLDKEEFALLREDARADNEKNLAIYTLVAVVVFAALVIVNALVGDMTSINQRHYLLMLAANLAIWLGMHFLVPKHPGLVQPLFYAFMGLLYAFSLAITAIHPELPAVTTIVLLFALPFLICDRPIHLVAMTVASVAALGIMVFACKPDPIARVDLWNGVSFAAVSIVAETLQQRSRFRMLAQARKIRLLSETDLLTGLKNRNHYENRQADYITDCQVSLSCLYLDVNGLHELNDTKGHHAGDLMLQAVAKELIEAFGQTDTYRIGGDEFVCLCPDVTEHVVREKVGQIAARLAEQNYFISTGVACQAKEELDMTALTAIAENEMYRAKRAFYAQAGRDRRRRREDQ